MSLSSSLPSWPVSQSVICGAVTPHQALFPWRQALMGGVGNPRWWEATVICKAGRLDNGRAVIGTASLRWEGDCNGGQQKCMQIWHFQTHLHMYTWMFFFFFNYSPLLFLSSRFSRVKGLLGFSDRPSSFPTRLFWSLWEVVWCEAVRA